MRLCSGPGCGRAVPDGQRFCAECKQERRPAQDNIKEHTDADVYGAELTKLNKGARWQRIRERAVQRCPMCARCNLVLTEIVDHIVPAGEAVRQARASGRFPYDRWAGYYLLSNLQGLCRACHAIKTQEDKARTEPWPSVIEAEDRAPKKRWTF